MTKLSQSNPPFLVTRITVVLALLLTPVGVAFGQALPAAEASPISTGFAIPTSLGSLQYAVSASQSLIWGYYGKQGSASSSTSLSGDVAYLSNSKLHPFSMVFSGGYSFGESNQESYSFLNLGFSQVANVGRWNFVVSDSVSLLPGTPVAGLSGVPGVGDLGVSPVQISSGDSGQGVLTTFSNRVTNTASGSVQRQITGKTSMSASGAYSTMRFLSSSVGSASASSAGLDSDSLSGGGGINHQIDVRTSYGANYAYSHYAYSSNNFGIATPDFSSQTATATFSHLFTRKLSFSAAAGPQWTNIISSNSGSSLSVFADVSTAYAAKSTAISLAFTRSSNGGYGAVAGAVSDSVVFGANRKFAVVWNLAVSSAFAHTSNLSTGAASYALNTDVEGIQVSRALMRNLSGYSSYTYEYQSNSGVSGINLFSGTTQVLGFGLTYSPSSLHLGRQ
jgi:hypothetical protein